MFERCEGAGAQAEGSSLLFIVLRNEDHVSVLNVRQGPMRSLLSRTGTMSGKPSATSTHWVSPPL